MNKDKCLVCGKEQTHGHLTPYCREHLVEIRQAETIQHWLETGDTGCGVATTLRNSIRQYIFKSQNCQCAICGVPNVWNGKELKFVLDHINGDASNNKKENLRLICPNCDSQLETFKSKNKNSARSFRKKYA